MSVINDNRLALLRLMSWWFTSEYILESKLLH